MNFRESATKFSLSFVNEISFGIVLLNYTLASLLKILNLPTSLILGILILISISIIFLISYQERDFFKKFIEKKFLLITLLILPFTFIVFNQNFESEFIGFILVIFLSYFAIFRIESYEVLLYIFKFIFYLVFFGVVLSIFEHYFLETTYLVNIIDNYPYARSGIKLDFGGFMYNYNAVTYFLICYLGLLSHQQSKIHEYFLPFGLLFLMFSKLLVLFLLLLIVIKFFYGSKRNLLIGISLIFYLILTNIIIVKSGDYSYPSMYFREKLFTFMDLDFVVSLHGWLKQQGFQALFRGDLNFAGFISEFGYQPHSTIISLSLLGGNIFAILFTAIIIFVSYRILQVKYFLESPILAAAFLSFCVELINWDFYDSFYFWILFFMVCRKYPSNLGYRISLSKS